MSRDDCVTDAAAYALGALEPSEVTAYEHHLNACAACREEVSAFETITDALPLSAHQYRSPRSLRRRVLRTVRAESRQAKANERRGGFVRLLLRTTAPRPVAAAASMIAVAAAAIAFAIIASGGSPASRLFPATVRGSTGTAALRISDGRGELIVRHFSAPPAGRIYEIWLKRPGNKAAPTSALFSVTAGGVADVGIPDDLRGVSEVLVTQEPAGGSPTPTGPAVIVARTS
jgi:anti-sigma-K factor RskA